MGAWTFPDSRDRVERLTEFWRPAVTAALKYDGAWMTPGAEAVAVWVPPGVPEMDEQDEQEAATTIARAVDRGHRWCWQRSKRSGLHNPATRIGTSASWAPTRITAAKVSR